MLRKFWWSSLLAVGILRGNGACQKSGGIQASSRWSCLHNSRLRGRCGSGWYWGGLAPLCFRWKPKVQTLPNRQVNSYAGHYGWLIENQTRLFLVLNCFLLFLVFCGYWAPEGVSKVHQGIGGRLLLPALRGFFCRVGVCMIVGLIVMPLPFALTAPTSSSSTPASAATAAPTPTSSVATSAVTLAVILRMDSLHVRHGVHGIDRRGNSIQ